MHTCPRCEAKQANLVSKSPVEGAWRFTYATCVCLPGVLLNLRPSPILKNTLDHLKSIQKTYRWQRTCLLCHPDLNQQRW